MKRSLIIVASLITCIAILMVIVIVNSGPRYKGRSLERWFNSTKASECIPAFQALGTNSFPVLLEKLNSRIISDRFKACEVIRGAFQKSQIENSSIEAKLKIMLRQGKEGERLDVYTTLRALGLQLSESEVSPAVKVSQSVRQSEQELARNSKLKRLQSVTNSMDCSVLIELSKDADPEVQIMTVDFFMHLGSNSTNNACSSEIAEVVSNLTRTAKDPSVVNAVLVYISSSPDRAHQNLGAICDLLKRSLSSEVQMDCLAILPKAGRAAPLPISTREVVESIRLNTNTIPEVRQFAAGLLANASLFVKPL